MDQPNLPRHVLERAERRWATVLSRQAAPRPAARLQGMQGPSPDSPRQLPEGKPVQSASSGQIAAGYSDLRLQR
jgi:hypothetical protein